MSGKPSWLDPIRIVGLVHVTGETDHTDLCRIGAAVDGFLGEVLRAAHQHVEGGVIPGGCLALQLVVQVHEVHGLDTRSASFQGGCNVEAYPRMAHESRAKPAPDDAVDDESDL